MYTSVLLLRCARMGYNINAGMILPLNACSHGSTDRRFSTKHDSKPTTHNIHNIIYYARCTSTNAIRVFIHMHLSHTLVYRYTGIVCHCSCAAYMWKNRKCCEKTHSKFVSTHPRSKLWAPLEWLHLGVTRKARAVLLVRL